MLVYALGAFCTVHKKVAFMYPHKALPCLPACRRLMTRAVAGTRARVHASRARSTRTHHACAPHQPCTCSHAGTCSTFKCLAAVLESLATGCPSAGSRLAHLARMRSAIRSPPALLASPMRRPHVVHAIHRRRCRTQRHDDNERDEDERHDEEDREHDGRCERVRFRSRLRLSRAMAHAHARCQACCT